MKQGAPPKESSFDEARETFEQMTGAAYLRLQAEKREARKRRPLVRILQASAIIASLAAGVVFFYGMIYFPDAPIKQTGVTYAGKQGRSHTREDYERFKRWEKALLTSGGVMAVFCLAFGVMDFREKRRRRAAKLSEK